MIQFQQGLLINEEFDLLKLSSEEPHCAASWFQHLETVQDDSSQTQGMTWEQFKTVLTQRFRPVAASQLARMQLYNIKQTGSVESYCQKFLEVISSDDIKYE